MENNNEEIQLTVVRHLEILTNFTRVFDFDRSTDYEALNQFWDKVNESMEPLLNKSMYRGSGRGKRELICLETKEVYDSAEDAEKDFNCSKQAIRMSCINKTMVFKVGKSFRFTDEI